MASATFTLTIAAAPASGWPTAANTGVPAGTALTARNGAQTFSTAGQVISGLNITGSVIISANNVTLKNCKITSGDYNTIKVAETVTGTVIQNCTIDGVGGGGNGILGCGKFIGNNIFNVENGIFIVGKDATLIQDSYIHGLKGTASSHYDNIQIEGSVSNVVIRHNTIINDYGQTGALMIDNNWGPVSNITVDNNILVGGGYTIYVDAHFNSNPITGVVITNNHIGPGGYGATNFNMTSPVYTGNVNDGRALAASIGA